MKEVTPGVYLAKAQDWKEEQDHWDEADGLKDYCFDDYSYYLIAPQEQLVMGFDSEDDAAEALREMIGEEGECH
jgi:hypothetical protein